MPSNTASKFHVKGEIPMTKGCDVGSSKRNIQRKHSGSKSSKKEGGGGKGIWHDQIVGGEFEVG